MANDLTSNPLFIDTAAATAVINSYISIQAIKWVDDDNDIADADSAIVQNGAGKVFWQHRLTTPGAIGDMQLTLPFPITIKGLIVPTLTHGALLIYWTPGRGQPTA